MGVKPHLFFKKTCDFFNEVPGRSASRLKKNHAIFFQNTIDNAVYMRYNEYNR